MIAFLLIAQFSDVHQAAIGENTVQVATLTAWGAASIATGAAIAIAKRDDKKWLSFGLMTAAVGAINVGFGVAGLITYGNERPYELPPREYQAKLIDRHRTEATTFAFNFGLDFCYVATGALLWVFGERFINSPVLHGTGMAAVIQGGALFIFDLVSWVLAENRGQTVARLNFTF